jgi:hypothetical protein
MNFNKNTYTYFIFFLWIALFCFLLRFGIFFFVGEFRELSRGIVLQKKVQNLIESRIKDYENFIDNYSFYEPVFEKIENSFVDKKAPIEFIEFLEKEANDANLSIKIFSLVVDNSEKKENWTPIGFQILLEGNFSNGLRFLERIERCPWLVEISQLNVEKNSENNNVKFSMEIRVLAR